MPWLKKIFLMDPKGKLRILIKDKDLEKEKEKESQRDWEKENNLIWSKKSEWEITYRIKLDVVKDKETDKSLENCSEDVSSYLMRLKSIKTM